MPPRASFPPRHALFAEPTPFELMARLSDHMGGPAIWMKRDDLTPLGMGGNKVRKLEFLIAEALAVGADTLVTIGGLQSNHCRQTAALAARLGLRCDVLLVEGAHKDRPAYRDSGNALLDRLFGAHIHILPETVDRDRALREHGELLASRGHLPFLMPAGGSTPIGTLGYVRAASELLGQFATHKLSPSAIIHSSGSGGTQAGLVCGLAAEGSTVPVVGISCGKRADVLTPIVDDLARSAANVIGRPGLVLPGAEVDDRQIGPGYGVPADATLQAIAVTARLEGVLLDPVYTGKAMAGLFAAISESRFETGQDVVFLHTGGAPALFAYGPELGALD